MTNKEEIIKKYADRLEFIFDNQSGASAATFQGILESFLYEMTENEKTGQMSPLKPFIY